MNKRTSRGWSSQMMNDFRALACPPACQTLFHSSAWKVPPFPGAGPRVAGVQGGSLCCVCLSEPLSFPCGVSHMDHFPSPLLSLHVLCVCVCGGGGQNRRVLSFPLVHPGMAISFLLLFRIPARPWRPLRAGAAGKSKAGPWLRFKFRPYRLLVM